MASDSFAKGAVCHLNCIDGYAVFCRDAAKYVGVDTDDYGKLSLYIARDNDGSFSFGSNYRPNWAKSTTKILGFPEARNIDDVFLNLDENDVDRKTRQQPDMLALYHRTVTIHADHSIFNADGSTDLDFVGLSSIKAHDALGRESDAQMVTEDSHPTFWAAPVAGCCLTARPPFAAAAIAMRLSDVTFSARDTHLLSWIADDAVETALSDGRAAQRRLPWVLADISEDDLAQLFHFYRGQTLVVLGRIENGRYVIRDDRRNQVFDMVIGQVRAMAIRNNVQLIDIGIQSREPDGTDAMPPAEAAGRIQAAFRYAETLRDFLSALASPDYAIIIDPQTFTAGMAVTAGIYAKSAKAGPLIRVAELGITTYDRDWRVAARNWVNDILGR